jgi:hypothetical protein
MDGQSKMVDHSLENSLLRFVSDQKQRVFTGFLGMNGGDSATFY